MRITGVPAEQVAYDNIWALMFTRITGPPTRKDRDGLEEEIKIILTRANVPGFTWAGKWGLVEEVIPVNCYKALTGKDYVEEIEPKVFVPSIRSVHANYIIKMKLAIWDQRQELYSI